MIIKLMSFNTQHCRNFVEDRIDFDIMAETIRTCGADIVGLNEMRGSGPDPHYTAQTEALAERLGMNYYFAPALQLPQGPYGNAILSRYPIISCEKIGIPDPDEGPYETRGVLKAVIDVGRPLTVIISHFGLNAPERVNAVRTVSANLEDKMCVLMGDFNCTPCDPVLLPIRGRMADSADLFDGEKLSFPSNAPVQKIDYIFLSPDIRAIAADIPDIVASDHRPHTACIEI